MTDDQLRQLVRDAVARHMAGTAGPSQPSMPIERRERLPSPAVLAVAVGAGTTAGGAAVAAVIPHPSHAQYVHLINADDTCVIEPSVHCNHCGYCRCHGH